jgi:DnaJ-class molecular chaperone
MKKPVVKNRLERECPGCNGTGFEETVQPSRPGFKVYPERCKQCLGKGRVAAN